METEEQRFFKIKLLKLNLFLGLLLILIIIRLFYLTIIQFNRDEMFFVNQIKTQGLRGNIYSQDGKLLATSLKKISFYIKRENLDFSKKKHLKKLCDLLNIPFTKVEKFYHSTSSFLWMKRFVDQEEASQIAFFIHKAKLKGIYQISEYQRTYPHPEISSHLLGFVNIDGKGTSGLEKYYNQELSNYSKNTPSKKNQSNIGVDLHLSIHYQISKQLNTYLLQALQNSKAESALGVIVNSNTGQIIAMENVPSFNPNLFFTYPNSKTFMNRAVETVDEPGSTIKPLVLALLTQNNKITPSELFNCSPTKKFGPYLIHDASYCNGQVNIRQTLIRSSNTAMGDIFYKKSSIDELYQYLQQLNFSSKTGIDLPLETSGLVNRKTMNKRSLVAIPIGQEFGISALQLVQTFGTFINYGVMMKPQIVDYLSYQDQILKKYQHEFVKRLFSKEIAEQFKEYLNDVVVYGSGKKSRIPGLQVIGKTGTAQIYDQKTKIYRFLNASFIASFTHPQNKQSYTIFILLRKPQISEKKAWGGTLSAPIAKKMILFMLKSKLYEYNL